MFKAARIKAILLNPASEWQSIEGENSTVAELYATYIIPLAAIGPIAFIIGMSIFGMPGPMGMSFRMPIGSALASGVSQFVMTLAGVYILALIIDALAPTFGAQKNFAEAFKIAAYSGTPGWVIGIVNILPALAFLSILGLYGLYLLYLGLPALMKSPKEKTLGYTIAVIIAAIVIFMVIGSVTRIFVPAPTMHGMG